MKKKNSVLCSELENLKIHKNNKKDKIDSLLETSNSLFKYFREPSSLVIQVSTSTDTTKSNGIHEINRKELIQQANQNRS